jgi:WD40 repeat protein
LLFFFKENESTKHVANVRKDSLIKEIKENETKWRDYLNNYSIDENLLQEAYKTLSDLQCKTEKELTELTGLLFNNKSCEFKSNTSVASLDFLGTVCVTEKISKQYFTKLDHSIQSLRGHSEGIYTLAALKNGELASGSFDGKIKIWNVSSCELIHTLRGHKEQIMALLPIGNNVLASGSEDKTVKIWNTRTAQLVYSFNEHTARVTDLILVGSQDSYLASSSWDNTIRVWDIKHGKLVHTLAGHSKSVNRLAALNVGGHLDLASGSFDNTIRLWSTSTGSQFKVLKSRHLWNC